MKIKIIKAEAEVREEDSRELKETVQSVINTIRNEGDKGVSEFTKKFDGIDIQKFILSGIEIEKRLSSLESTTKELIDTNISRIKKFAEFQMGMYKEMLLEVDNGGTVLGQRIILPLFAHDSFNISFVSRVLI